MLSIYRGGTLISALLEMRCEDSSIGFAIKTAILSHMIQFLRLMGLSALYRSHNYFNNIF
jgi:hypothetical protein